MPPFKLPDLLQTGE